MKNRGVVYKGPNVVAVEDIPFPTLHLAEQNRPCPHGVIVRVIASCICGSDVHMYRGRTTAEAGIVFGHEITGEVVERGPGVEFVKVGDVVSVPFNIACGRCANCEAGHTGVCLRVNPKRAGSAYGYVDMGGWAGGQARFAMVPYADFNALVIDAPRHVIMDKIASIALLADILPTGYHGAVSAGVTTGSTVYVAGAGPVGLACATACQMLGAAVVIVGDLNEQRLAAARAFGCKTVNLSHEQQQPLEQQLAALLGRPEVDCAIDCVGFEARGCGGREEQPAAVLNQLMGVTRAAGQVSLVGLYVTDDPGSRDANARAGSLSLRIGLGWAKSLTFVTGQCPVKRYNRQLLSMILHSDIDFAKRVNAVVVPLEQAAAAYKDFDGGAAKKYILDCNGLIAAHRKTGPKL